jgi:hypothetical protein
MVLELLRQRASIREVRRPGGRGGSSFLPGSGCGCGYENPEANTGPHVLALEAIGQPVERGAGLGGAIQRVGEVRRLGHYPRLGVEPEADLDHVASAIPLAARLAALMPTMNRSPIDATRLCQV